MTPTRTFNAEPSLGHPRAAPPSLARRIMRPVQTVAVALVAFLVLGNLAIVAMHVVARATAQPPPAEVGGVAKLQAIDAKVWRGGAPSRRGYIDLAAAGVETIVDLRAEADLHVDEDLLRDLGVRLVRMPVRDGQVPSPAQVEAFLGVVESADGLVFVHCGAGVGRTGSMAAAYVTATGQGNGWEALRRNLAVGPPSLEQVAFVARMDGDGYHRPRPTLVALSRVLDAPRRLWSRFGL